MAYTFLRLFALFAVLAFVAFQVDRCRRGVQRHHHRRRGDEG